MQGPTERWLFDAYASFWINLTSRKLLRLHEARLRPLGLGMGQIPVLLALIERGSLSQKELIEVAKVEQPTMAEMLVRMERDGLVRRTSSDDDKRVKHFACTPRARAQMTKAKLALEEGEREATKLLSEDERALLIRLLRRVEASIEAVSEARK